MIWLNAGEDESNSSWLFSMIPVSHGVSSPANDDGDSVSSSVAPGISSSEKPTESGLVITDRGDRAVRRLVRVFGEGGAFGSRRRERMSAVRMGKVSACETSCGA